MNQIRDFGAKGRASWNKMRRDSIAQRRLFGPSYKQLTELKRAVMRKAAVSGRAYMYRVNLATAMVHVSPTEIVGFGELVACYDANVTTPMLREDLYGEESDE